MQRSWHFNQCQWLNEDFDVISLSALCEERLNPVFNIHLWHFQITLSRYKSLSALWWSMITGAFKQHWQRNPSFSECNNVIYTQIWSWLWHSNTQKVLLLVPCCANLRGCDFTASDNFQRRRCNWRTASRGTVWNCVELMTATLMWQHVFCSTISPASTRTSPNIREEGDDGFTHFMFICPPGAGP